MATLPDINTSNVGMISYWNAINSGGVSSINASDCLADGNISSYTLYDNGFVANYDITYDTYFGNSTTRTVTARVKQDGWFVVYMDRTNNYQQSQSVPTRLNGYWDVIDSWTNVESPSNAFPQSKLERAIHSLQSNLSNSGSVTYNQSDVDMYNYEFTSATNTTMMSARSGGDTLATYGSIYTSGTNVLFYSCQGSSGSYVNNRVDFEGTTICATEQQVGTLDVLSLSLAPNPNTEYDSHAFGHSNSTGENAKPSILTIWS